ncbi:TPA: hypothetical protein ACHUW8_004369, partial [Shigella flexneri]
AIAEFMNEKGWRAAFCSAKNLYKCV